MTDHIRSSYGCGYATCHCGWGGTEAQFQEHLREMAAMKTKPPQGFVSKYGTSHIVTWYADGEMAQCSCGWTGTVKQAETHPNPPPGWIDRKVLDQALREVLAEMPHICALARSGQARWDLIGFIGDMVRPYVTVRYHQLLRTR